MEPPSKFREYLKYRPLGPVGTFIGVFICTPVIMLAGLLLSLALGTLLARIGIDVENTYSYIFILVFTVGVGIAFIKYETRQSNKKYISIAGILGLVLGFIIISIPFSALRTQRPSSSRDARRVADVNQLRLALELYFDPHESYPSSLSALSDINGCREFPCIVVVPSDPITQKPYFYVEYKTDDKKSHYHLGANLDAENMSILAADKDSQIGFDGSDSKGCGGEKDKYCYDISW